MAREHAEGLAGTRRAMDVRPAPARGAEAHFGQRPGAEVESAAPPAWPEPEAVPPDAAPPEPTDTQPEPHPQEPLHAAAAPFPQTPGGGPAAEAGGARIRLAKADTRWRLSPASRLLVQIVLVSALVAVAALLAWLARR